jgi:hypothetical protein
MSTPISLQDFDAYVAALALHDWYYDFSDDASVYRAGRIKHQQLTQQADSSPLYSRAYGLYAASGVDLETRGARLATLRKEIEANLLTQEA